MKKLFAVVASFVLVATLSTPAQSAGTNYSVYQKTLTAFTSSATTLTAQQKAQVKAAVEANPDAEKFICTGIRYYSQPTSVNIMVRKRAKAACDYAKQLNPNLSTWFQNKPTQARSYAGKVLLTAKSIDKPMTIETVDYGKAAMLASTAVNSLAKSPVTISDYITFVESPRVPAELSDEVRLGLERAASLWGAEGIPDGAEVVIFTNDKFRTDLHWVQTWLDTNGIGDWVPGGVRSYFFSSRLECNALAGSPKGTKLMLIAVGCPEDESFGLGGHLQNAPHELTHWFQDNHENFLDNAPSWLVEGSAAFYGTALGMVDLKDPIRARSEFYFNNYRGYDFANKLRGTSKAFQYRFENATVSTVGSLYALVEGTTGSNGELAYGIGGIAVETLVAVYGHQKFIDLMDSFATSSDWRANFESTYAISVDDFYRKLTHSLNAFGAEHTGF